MKTELFPNIERAAAAGYATFNEGPHLAIEVPDGNFTLSARMSDGKRIVFSFAPYRDGAPAGCVDIAFLDSGLPTVSNGQHELHPFHSIGFGPGHNTYDTRTVDRPTTLITVLVDERDYRPS